MSVTLKILKLGGSVITHKHQDSAALNRTHLETLIAEIKRWLALRPEHRLVLITGAGSYGHPLAKRYALNAPSADKDPFGFLATTLSMRQMGLEVARLCHAQGVPVFPIAPSNLFTTEAGRISTGQIEAIPAALERGLVPLLWGDAVFDTAHRFRILSGDQIAGYLCERLEIASLLFGTDVNGVYDDDPAANPSAVHIPCIEDANIQSVLGVLSSSRHVDVTGGMRGKIAEIYAIHLRPLRCTIFDARQDGLTYRALSGESVGTVIAFD